MWDIYEVNLIDLDKLVRELGVKGDYKIWYVVPGRQLKDVLRLLKTDRDVVRFQNEYKAEESVTFYLEHLDITELDNICEDEVHKWVGDESESGTDSEYEGDESESESVDGVSLNDSNYNEDFDWTTVLLDQLINPKHAETSSVQTFVAGETSKNLDATTLSNFDDENGDSDNLESICSSEKDTGTGKQKISKFKLSDVITYVVGQIFTSVELLRTSVREFALQKRKNERKRIVVKGLDNCPFHMRFSKSEPKTYFVLARYNPDHKCHNTGKSD